MSRTTSPPDDELAKLIRTNLLRAGVSLILFAALAIIVVSKFKPELDHLTTLVFTHVGVGGLVALIFVTDTLISPIPPDSVLFLVANSEYHASWGYVIPIIGVVSTIGGWLGYALGRYFSNKPLVVQWFGATRVKAKKMILRFGPWAVALGAMTPVPFSITCWSAGLLHLPFRLVWKPCLLRIPRYVIFYAVIAYAPELIG